MAKGQWHMGPNGPGKCRAEKGQCPYGEGDHFNSEGEASPIVNEEESYITQMLLSRLSKQKANIIFDITMSSTKIDSKKSGRSQKNSYRNIEAFFVDISVDNTKPLCQTASAVDLWFVNRWGEPWPVALLRGRDFRRLNSAKEIPQRSWKSSSS